MSDEQKCGICVSPVEIRFLQADASWDEVEGWTVPGDLDLSGLNLTSLPLIKEIVGNLDCRNNQLASLAGCPGSVGGNFICSNNKLINLVGGPTTVGGNYICSENLLTSLEGSPTTIGGCFFCQNNKLASLEGMSSSVGKDVLCSANELVSLAGVPTKIFGHFYCSENQLTSLDTAPSEVVETFWCTSNPGPDGEGFSKSDIEAVCSVGGEIVTDIAEDVILEGGIGELGGVIK